MRKPREIRRHPKIDAEICNDIGGIGMVSLDTWKGTVAWGTDERGWEHVSVAPNDKSITPTWDEMCVIKDIFFNDEELVVQIHPPKSEYVNLVENCLHLWRRNDGQFEKMFFLER